jgi:predicted nuclease with TOPRIM domain
MSLSLFQSRLVELQKQLEELQAEGTDLVKELQFKSNRLNDINVRLIQLEGAVKEVSAMLDNAKSQETTIIEA